MRKEGEEEEEENGEQQRKKEATKKRTTRECTFLYPNTHLQRLDIYIYNDVHVLTLTILIAMTSEMNIVSIARWLNA